MVKNIRSAIVTVAGHVDHGKTSILDSLRESSVQESEAGGITQKISFTSYPIEHLKKTFPIIEKSGINLKIPGFLFIDTPGHASFTNLRKRGGGLADLAILVIDINDGIKPQTAEVIQILKHNKTPFIIALNKIDNISGWRTPPQLSRGGDVRKHSIRGQGKEISLKEDIESQSQNTKQIFEEKYFTLIGSLSALGIETDLFYNISDFTKKIALVPCSAKTKQGISELMLMVCGLSQKYLEDKLELGKDAKGVILEIKKEKSMNYAESILYDGELSKDDKISVANLEGKPIITKIRILEEIEPLHFRFKPKKKVQASTGLRMQFSGSSSGEKIDVLPGMPFVAYKGNKEEIEKIFKQEISENIQTQKQGIIAKADSLGSLEALLVLLKQNNVPVVKASIGNINKTDIISAKANLKINELDALIVGFNVSIDEEAKEIQKGIKIFTDEVIYKLIENINEFRIEKRKEIEKKRLLGLSSLCKLNVLHKYVFRNTKPAIFGIKIEVGKINQGLNLIDEKGEKVGRVKNIQSENKSVKEAVEEMEIAVSIPGVNFERQMKNKNFLYSDISETQFKNLKKNKDLLSQKDIKLLEEIAKIKRQEKADWGF